VEKFFQYPARSSPYIYAQKKSAVYGFNGITILTTHDDATASKARYIAAALNACKDMDTAKLESGAPGWIAEKLANKTKARIDAEYSEAETESALNELHAFGQKMYDAICEIVQNAPFDSKFDLENLVQDGERFFVVKAPMKKIETLKDLRDVVEGAPEYFDTQKVFLVDGFLRIGEHPTEPAYFVGNENGIEDTDAPPDNGGYTDAELNCKSGCVEPCGNCEADAQPREFCRPRGLYKELVGEYSDVFKNQ